ncbi:hypothetical protein JK182_01410 [Acetobacter okinawensis]|uniref:hypothetical protein n=1 Tax=Acetobacter okinawensis TaxID=1076594 RepID=UPI001BAD4940|nr:hypothetical protein [Acetobacter okinawensis]MBS0987349.1 hypothetical protein [Acetobacter okinawensis]
MIDQRLFLELEGITEGFQFFDFYDSEGKVLGAFNQERKICILVSSSVGEFPEWTSASSIEDAKDKWLNGNCELIIQKTQTNWNKEEEDYLIEF